MKIMDRKEVIMSRVNAQATFAQAMQSIEACAMLRECYVRIFGANHRNHYFGHSLDQPGKISYSEKMNKKYDAKTRTRTTIGRYLTRQLPSITDGHEAEIDRFSRAWLALTVTANFELVAGRAIVDAFETRIGGKSCMTGPDAWKTVIYSANPDVKMLLFSDQDFSARALVWETDCGETLIDRIYPNSGYHVDAIHRWAEQRGWWHRAHQSLPDGDVHFILGDDIRSDFTVTLKHDGIFPYFDSLRYGTQDGAVVNLSAENRRNDHTFESCTGHGPEPFECEHCESRMTEDETLTACDGCTVCEDCLYEHYSSCDSCDVQHPNNDMVSVCRDSMRYRGVGNSRPRGVGTRCSQDCE